MKIIDYPIPRGGTREQTEPLNADRVVVHSMGEWIKGRDGKVYHAPDWLKKIGYSAHVLVAPDGTIYRCREDWQEAIHAYGNNDALGIEFLVQGTHNYGTFLNVIEAPYLSEMQYMAGVEFVRNEWVEKKGILHYQRHCDADPRGIKHDPGEGFPWRQFLADIGVIYGS